MLLLILVSFLISCLICFLLIQTKQLHGKYSHDAIVGVQKFHKHLTPRIGGLSILLSLFFTPVFFYYQFNANRVDVLLITLAALPVFLIGLLEDLTKSISPRVRLLFACCSAVFFIYYLHVSLQRIDWLWFDNFILQIPMLSALVTLFMLVGVSQATNIIDGFNGLLLGFCIIALSIFLYLSYSVNDGLLINLITLLLGSVLGLFVFNFPNAKLFTGDGGAYLLGFLLACISLLLVQLHTEISPWCPLLIVSYPVFETLFSIFRRKILNSNLVTQPDAAHLHSLIYKFLEAKLNVKSDYLNARASVSVWLFVILTCWPAFFWPSSTEVMIISIVNVCVNYLVCYFTLLRALNIKACITPNIKPSFKLRLRGLKG